MRLDGKVVCIVARAWFPNHQELFDRVALALQQDGVVMRYGVMMGAEKGRRWSPPRGGVTIIPEQIGSGTTFTIGDKQMSWPGGVRRWISAAKPDCIVATPCSEIGNFIAIAEARRRKIPAIGWMVGVRDSASRVIDRVRLYCSRRIHREFCRRIDVAFTYGSKAASDIRSLGLIAPPRIIVVRHTIDERDYWVQSQDERALLGAEFRRAHAISPGFAFGYIGQLIKRKGADLLLDAFVNILRSDRTVQLVVLGKGPLKAKINWLAGAYPQNVVLLDDIKQSDMRALYSAVDCILVPSRFDDWSTVINECICSQTPVLSSNGAHASYDLLSSQQVFAQGSQTALEDAMRRYLHCPLPLSELVTRQKWYASQWTLQAAADLWAHNLIAVLGRPAQEAY